MNTIQIEYKEKYAIIMLDQGKVNAMNQEMGEDLAKAFTDLEANDAVQGVILSGRPHCFSAGLDILSLASSGLPGMESFWRVWLKTLQIMAGFKKPMIAAITGYSPAGATVLACCADYRIMGRGEKHVIGMHEVKLSLQIPELMGRIYAHVLGDVQARDCVFNSKLMHADDAKAIGLVNEACEVEEVLPKAEKMMQKWTQCYGPILSKTKVNLNKELVAKLDMDMDDMIKEILSGWDDPVYTQMLMQFVASIKK